MLRTPASPWKKHFLFEVDGCGFDLPVGLGKKNLVQRVGVVAPMIVRWLWKERHESSQVLVIVPGDREMDMVRLALLSASARGGASWQVSCVNSKSGGQTLARLCKVLERQAYRPNFPTQFLVVTAGLCDDSVTFPINGLINSGDVVTLDEAGFLKLRVETAAQREQREGRAARVHDCVVVHLADQPSEDCDVVVTYDSSLQAALVASALGLRSCELALNSLRFSNALTDLAALGCCEGAELTSIGKGIVNGSGAVREGVFLHTCKRLGVRAHGEIAAA